MVRKVDELQSHWEVKNAGTDKHRGEIFGRFSSFRWIAGTTTFAAVSFKMWITGLVHSVVEYMLLLDSCCQIWWRTLLLLLDKKSKVFL